MKASELIIELQKLIELHGDQLIYIPEHQSGQEEATTVDYYDFCTDKIFMIN